MLLPQNIWRGAHIPIKKIYFGLLISWSTLQNMNIVALVKVPQPGIAYLGIVAYLKTKVMFSHVRNKSVS